MTPPVTKPCPRACGFVAVATTEGAAIRAIAAHLVYHALTKEAGK